MHHLKLITKLAESSPQAYCFTFQEKIFDKTTVSMWGKAGKDTQEGEGEYEVLYCIDLCFPAY